MNNDKFDNMMKKYCDKEVDAFEFKDKSRGVRSALLVAAALVIIFLSVVIIKPNHTLTDNNKNSFVLTVSAADTSDLKANASEDESDEKFNFTHMLICVSSDNYENIKSISARSKSGKIKFDFRYSVKISEKGEGAFYESHGKLEKHNDTRITENGITICDTNGKEITIDCSQLDESGKILPNETEGKFNDVIITTVEFKNGEVKTSETPVYLSDCDTKVLEIY